MLKFGDEIPRAAKVEPDFFKYLKEWSRRKHQVLEHYADAFCRIKGDLYCIDGFAGRGEYRDGNPGSPILAADIAKRNLDAGRRYRLRCINVEKEPEHYSHLQIATGGYPTGVVTNYGPGEFSEHVDSILQQIGTCAALFFLDPFGIDGLEWTTLKPILERSQRYTTELLINFNVRYVPRLAGHLASEASSAPGKVELLTSVLGTDTWKQCVQTDAEDLSVAAVVPLGECIGALYEHQLKGYFRHVYHYAVRSVADELVRYHLIFATNNDKGVAVMSDILCRTEDQYQTERERLEATPAVQMPLFEEARPPTQEEIIAARGQALREAMCEKLRVDPRHRMTFLRLQAAVAEAGFFAKVKRTTYCSELKTLRSQGLVSWRSQTRQPEDDVDILWCG